MPRIQEHLFINRATGDVTITRGILPDADLATRIRDLKAAIPDMDSDAVRHASVRCDGCQVVVELDWDDPRAPDGWAEREGGDVCPACS